MSRCYQNVIHVQLTYFYWCIFHWRPTDNLYHCWVIMYYRLNRWCVSAIARPRAAACTVTESLSGRRKRVRHKVMSRDQSVILRGWLIVVIKSIIKAAVTECLAAWGQMERPRPRDLETDLFKSHISSRRVSNLLIQLWTVQPSEFFHLNIEAYYNIEVLFWADFRHFRGGIFHRVRKTLLWPYPDLDWPFRGDVSHSVGPPDLLPAALWWQQRQ